MGRSSFHLFFEKLSWPFILLKTIMFEPTEFLMVFRNDIYFGEKTQREQLNQRLISSLDSTQFRIRNAHFFLKFKICSINKFVLFSFVFLFTFWNFFSIQLFAFNRWVKDFSATFFLLTTCTVENLPFYEKV